MKCLRLVFSCFFGLIFSAIIGFADCAPQIYTEDLPQWVGDLSAFLERVNHQTQPNKGRGIDVSAVYGSESREQVVTPVFPWTAVGQLSSGCTGTLVGECLVLTAAHCVHFDENGNVEDQNFHPRFDILHSYPFVKVTTPLTWQIQDEKRKKIQEDGTLKFSTDWAIVKVKGKPGNLNGVVGVKSDWLKSRSVSSVKKFYVAGYSQDFANGRLSVDNDGKALEVARSYDGGPSIFRYRADTSSGSSGGPIFDNEFDLIGVNTRAVFNPGGGRMPVYLPDTDGEAKASGVPADYFFDELLKFRSEKCDD